MTKGLGLFTVGIFGPFFIHSLFIFNTILIPFFQKMKLRMKAKWQGKWTILIKWSHTLTFTKSDLKNDHFLGFWPCAWQVKCIFTSFFWTLVSRVFTVTIFDFIFDFIIVCLLPNHQKCTKNEAENEPKMAWKCQPWTTLLICPGYNEFCANCGQKLTNQEHAKFWAFAASFANEYYRKFLGAQTCICSYCVWLYLMCFLESETDK